MEELKFLSAAVLALILAVSCQNEYDPAAGDPDSGIAPGTVTVRCTAALLFINGGWTRFRCIL